MRDLNSAASVVKSISFNHSLPWSGTLSNRYFLGFQWGGFVRFFEKSTLFSDSSATEGIQIPLPATNLYSPLQVAFNTTSIVSFRTEIDNQGSLITLLAKKDFWMTNNILPVPLMGHNNCAVL